MYFDQVKFGNRLRNLRKQRGKTQEQLAAAVNIGTVHLGNIELGKRGLSIDLMIELSNVLNVSLDYLMLFADGKSTGDSRFSGARGCSHLDGTK